MSEDAPDLLLLLPQSGEVSRVQDRLLQPRLQQTQVQRGDRPGAEDAGAGAGAGADPHVQEEGEMLHYLVNTWLMFHNVCETDDLLKYVE